MCATNCIYNKFTSFLFCVVMYHLVHKFIFKYPCSNVHMHEECFRGVVEAIVTYLFPGFPTLKLYNFNVHVPEGGSLGTRLTCSG